MKRGKTELLFLKIGGSVMGDKFRARSFRAAAIRRIGEEIASFMQTHPHVRLLLAHGGGPMAHAPAAKYHTRQGLPGGGGWRGFAETRRGVLETNCRVLDAFAKGGLFPVLVPPVASCMASHGKIARWDTAPIAAALRAGQVPMIHGDVILDETLGFTIAGTEEQFAYLAPRLKPSRMLFACDVPGVLMKTGARTATVVPVINRKNISSVRKSLSPHSKRYDVTGGMVSKVALLHRMATRHRVQSVIFSGLRAGAVCDALAGIRIGTEIA